MIPPTILGAGDRTKNCSPQPASFRDPHSAFHIHKRRLFPMSYEHILTRREKGAGLVQFNRPKALNALSPALMAEVMDALEAFDADPEIGCLVVTGNERAFAAGADIKEMAQASVVDMLDSAFIDYWDRFNSLRKPVIAAVSGFALGGGCEFAMACDMIVASESAQFGQPEINLGVIPGAGGTQRMTRAVGKALAMEIVLNDRRLTAEEALRFGLVNRVVPVELYLEEALALAQEIAARAPVAARLAKEAINAVFETPLSAGLRHERRLFYMLFATEDQKEGMDAFINKRQAEWRGK
jgi:enoyl-CoA hydratase